MESIEKAVLDNTSLVQVPSGLPHCEDDKEGEEECEKVKVAASESIDVVRYLQNVSFNRRRVQKSSQSTANYVRHFTLSIAL